VLAWAIGSLPVDHEHEAAACLISTNPHMATWPFPSLSQPR
jgi:hypothetical protein